MIIRTEDKSAYQESMTLFSTETGIRYSLSISNKRVLLHIDSAHGAEGDYGTGVYYQGKEAVDFWDALRDGIPKNIRYYMGIHLQKARKVIRVNK